MSSNNRDPNFITGGYKTINKIVKEQNKRLLAEIAKFKEMDSEETKEFIEEYLKPNYYMLEITASYKKEQQQRNYIF
tara:strand:+ start:1188 stop:1418 length:231 start_codon:yes stop_codon:yes gene_type:complete